MSGDAICFAGLQDKSSELFRAREWFDVRTPEPAKPTGVWSRIATALFFPVAVLGRLVEWNGGVERGRWPTPRPKLLRYVLHSVSGLLGGIYPPLLGLIACLVVGIGAYHLVGTLGKETITTWRLADWSDPASYFSRPIVSILNITFMAVAVLMVFVTLLGVVVNYVLLRASRRLLFGLATTYVAGPGAPAWFAARPNVIALPIPPSVMTLSFGLSPKDRSKLLVEPARLVTLKRLEEFFRERAAS